MWPQSSKINEFTFFFLANEVPNGRKREILILHFLPILFSQRFSSAKHVQLLRNWLSHKSVKTNVTIPNGLFPQERRGSILLFPCIAATVNHHCQYLSTWPGMLIRFNFRAEKRYEHAQVLAARQDPSLKKWREFRRPCKQKQVANFICFPNSPSKQHYFLVTTEKLLYWFRGESSFFRRQNLT